MMMKIVRKQEGFTLIELLIVVIILGILAVLAIPRFMLNQQQAQTNTCQANLRMIADAVERSMFSTGAVPANVAALVATGELRSEPVCPVGNAAYAINAGTGAVTCANGHTLPAPAAP